MRDDGVLRIESGHQRVKDGVAAEQNKTHYVIDFNESDKS